MALGRKVTVDSIFKELTSKVDVLKGLVKGHREEATRLVQESVEHDKAADRGEKIVKNFEALLVIDPVDDSSQ